MPLTPDLLVSYYETADPKFDSPAFQGLSSVDWRAVTHAHGPATDIPALLRTLVSDVSDHRDFACKLLFEIIWHQGTVYEATAVAVPFLYKLLEVDGPHDKACIAHLLATIADGQPGFASCEGNAKETKLWASILSKEGRSLDVEIARGRKSFEAIRGQIRSRIDLLYPYPRHSAPEIRQAVVVAIGKFPDIVQRVHSDLERTLQVETDN